MSSGTENIVQNMRRLKRHNVDSSSCYNTERPIVFTTRLDDMNVFEHEIKFTDPEELTETIINESKPKFTPDLLNHPKPYKKNEMSFMQLKYKIKDYNEYRLKNRCSIKNNPTEQVDCDLTLSDDDFQTSHTDNMVKHKELKNAYIFINDNSTNITHIYYLNQIGRVTQVLKTRSNNIDQIYLSHKNAKDIKINPCCWYKREEEIRSLKKLCSHSALQFFKKPHKCALNKCICCCRFFLNNTFKKTFSDVPNIANNHFEGNLLNINDSNALLTLDVQEENKKIESDNCQQQLNAIGYKPNSQLINSDISASDLINKMLTNSCTSPSEPMSLIKKALKYHPRLPSEKMVRANNSNKVTYLNHARIQITDASTLATKVYVIGSTGEIQEHYKSNYVSNDNNEKDKLEFNETVCCWFKHKNFMKLLHAKNISPNALKFIKMPHKCPNGECKCCCQRIVKQPTENITFNNVILHESPIVTSEFHNKITCLKLTLARSSYQTKYPEIDAQKRTNKSKQKTNQRQSTEKKLSEVIDVSDTNVVPTAKKALNDKLHFVQVEMLINRALKNFGAICLKINDFGKITTKLNTSLNNLSTVELKVLRTILANAQKQVESLELTPGTNLKIELDTQTPAVTHASELSVTVAQQVTKSGEEEKNITISREVNNSADVIDLTDTQSSVTPSSISDPDCTRSVYKQFVTLASQKRVHYLEALKKFIGQIPITDSILSVDNPHKEDVVPLLDISSTSDQTTVTDVTKTAWDKKRKSYEGKMNITGTASKKV